MLWTTPPQECSSQLIFPILPCGETPPILHSCARLLIRREQQDEAGTSQTPFLGEVGSEGIQLSRILIVDSQASGYQLEWCKL